MDARYVKFFIFFMKNGEMENGKQNVGYMQQQAKRSVPDHKKLLYYSPGKGALFLINLTIL